MGVCVSMCSIRQLSSWPPYAELGAQAGSICQVNAQPRPQPQQLAPTSLIIRGGIVQEHTAAHSRRTPTHVVTGCGSWERRGVSHNGKVIGAWEDISEIHHAWTAMRWMLAAWIHFSWYSAEQLGKVSISGEVKWGEDRREGHWSSGDFDRVNDSYEYVMSAVTTLAFLLAL